MSNEEDPKQGKELQTQVVAEFVQNQKRELEIRARELQLKTQEDEHAFIHAGKALEAQERDRKDQRVFHLRAAKHRYWFIAAIVLVAVGFIITLAIMNKDQMIMEIVKTIAYLAAGAIGGFYYGKNRGLSEANDSFDPSDQDK